MIASDDFAGGSLSPVWRIEGPSGVSARVASDSTNAFLELVTPNGDHDLWGTNNGARALQATADTDFQLETRFLTIPTQQYQMQGFLVEQDAQNWLRFDTYSDGATLHAFAAVTIDGVPNWQFDIAIPGGTAPYLRLTRTDDLWRFDYSQNGVTWTTAGSVTHALTATAAGVFAGNTGQADGYTARVDYFENTADPITDEDGTITPPPPNSIASDDFAGGSLDPVWRIEGPAGVSAGVASDSTNAFLELITPNGDYDLWGVNNGARALQATADTDFQLEARFLTIPTQQYQMQGFLVEQDAQNWLRFDTYFDGSSLHAFAAVTIDSVSSSQFDITIAGGTAPYLRLTRTDDLWSFDYSQNGVTWTTAGSVTHALTATAAGVFAGNTGQAAGYTARIDYFENTADPITDEDGTITPPPSGSIVSDDFAGGSLGSVWRIEGPSGVSAGVASVGTDAFLELVTPNGNYDLWGTNNGARALQATADTDFQLEARFLTVPTQQYQMQGFLVEQDAQNWLRFDTYSDGSSLHAFAAVTADGVSSGQFDVAIVESAAPYLRLTRTGDLWNFEYSQNGVAWTTAGSFTHALTATAAGVFAGNTGDAAGYTARVDYFENTADPIIDEDGTVTPVNPVDVWYGLEQTFGSPGEAQEWINILGSVGGEVASLSYSLNGGPARLLSVGPDTRRLQNDGDFNIDISYSELDGSPTDDIVTITATMDSGAIFARDVVVNYASGQTWTPNYDVQWDSVTDIQDVVQVVDGTWEIDNGGVRPVDLGYDRLIAIGDRSWDNYELSLTITMHDLQNMDPLGRDGGGFAIGMLWNGHTDTPIANWQPKVGWEPGAAFFYTNDANGAGVFTLHSSMDFFNTLASEAFTLAEGLTYNFRVRVEQTGLYDRLYSLRVWEDGTAEPTNWTIQGTETFDLLDAPGTGSIYLNAHYFDVAFNDLTATEITGRDIVQGTNGNDQLSAAHAGNGTPSQGEIDVFAGYDGADRFVFGDLNGDYYDRAGSDDYGFVWDFLPGVDQIQLAGTADDYVLATDYAGLPTGTAIFRAGGNGQPGELIGILNDARDLSLASSDFIFVSSDII